MLAGLIYLDIMLGFQVGESTAYAVFHETCAKLGMVLKLLGIPSTIDEVHNLALGFKHPRKKVSPIYCCIGVVDSIAIKIRKCTCRNAATYYCRKAATYYCRKGYYSLPVQAVVDSSYFFLDV